MKRIFTLLFCLLLLWTAPLQAKHIEASSRKAFTNVGLSINGTLMAGVGFSLSTPLARHFVLRAGYQFSPYNISYTYDGFEPMSFLGVNFQPSDIDFVGDVNMGAAHMMFDWVPFKRGTGSFFLTAGVYWGAAPMLDVQGQFDMSSPDMQFLQKLGLLGELEFKVDEMLFTPNNDGSMSAKLHVAALRPYVGLGWGRAIPKRRFGFRFEMGAIFCGHLKIESANLSENLADGPKNGVFSKIQDINVFPQISLQLTYKLFKDK